MYRDGDDKERVIPAKAGTQSLPTGIGIVWDRRPRRSTVLLMGPGLMIAGMTKSASLSRCIGRTHRSHSREGGNPVFITVVPLGPGLMIAGMTNTSSLAAREGF